MLLSSHGNGSLEIKSFLIQCIIGYFEISTNKKKLSASLDILKICVLWCWSFIFPSLVCRNRVSSTPFVGYAWFLWPLDDQKSKQKF